ncbi:sulfotransferase [Candidatus Pelagibacter sp.]|nr:sulfotransferase [Candidatus Pelagibacter sp.]
MKNIDYLKEQISITINLFQAKKFDELILKGSGLIKKFPDQPIFYNITALAYNAVGKSGEAKKLLIKVLSREPKNIDALNNIGLASVDCGEDIEAEKYYNRALEINSNFVGVLVNLGNLKIKQNKNEEAKELFIKAIKINNKITPPKIALAGYYEQSGNFEEAKNLYKEIQKDDPSYTVADKSLSLIHKYKIGDSHLKTMEEKLTNDIDDDSAQRLNFALGKAYEDIGDYENSFKFIRDGNKLYKKNTSYNVHNEIRYLKKIKKFFEENQIKSLDNFGQKIIFILGMPRSGTTLTEQILSSHQNVYGAGELSFLKDAIEKKLLDNDDNFRPDLLNLNPELLTEIKINYLQKIEVFENKKEYLIDKAPLNFKWIGFIIAMFPDSKIIHCTRNSMDICWSNYKNSFPSKSMGYTYDLDDLAIFYNGYDYLTKFWLNKFDKKIFNMSYENLIINKQLETKKMLEFCNLDWDNNCLDFHKNKKPVSTASLAQIRQPLYNSSVGKWKNYSSNLETLKKQLAN